MLCISPLHPKRKTRVSKSLALSVYIVKSLYEIREPEADLMIPRVMVTSLYGEEHTRAVVVFGGRGLSPWDLEPKLLPCTAVTNPTTPTTTTTKNAPTTRYIRPSIWCHPYPSHLLSRWWWRWQDIQNGFDQLS